MTNPLQRLPWFMSAPGFLAAVLIAAFVANYLGADYFKRTRLDEANPLAGFVAAGADATSTAVIASGIFRDGEPGHRGSGTATLLRAPDGSHTLRLEDFSVTNGPDLYVVLSTSDGYTESGLLDLGRLKATDGSFNYAIPAGTDVSGFRSAIIWCRQFRVTFAVAALAPGGSASDAQTPAAQASGGATPVPASPTVPAAETTPAPTATPSATSAPPTQSAAQPAATPRGPQVLAQGTFRDGEPGHRGSGLAKLGRDAGGKPVLVLEDFSVTNGPDLHVILSEDPRGSGSGLDLGKLKATDGTFSYNVPEDADLTKYRSVTIWCASFPTIFAVATLGS